VTRADYARFLRARETSELPELAPRDRDGTFLLGDAPADELDKRGRDPITGVRLAQAREYARWAGGRLPTRGELWAARARGAEGVLRELVEDDATARWPDVALVLDLRVVRDERDVVGEERLERAGLGSHDITFRIARGAPEGP
jgi:formylglycine-generating enzyme required for sulfatase activity